MELHCVVFIIMIFLFFLQSPLLNKALEDALWDHTAIQMRKLSALTHLSRYYMLQYMWTHLQNLWTATQVGVVVTWTHLSPLSHWVCVQSKVAKKNTFVCSVLLCTTEQDATESVDAVVAPPPPPPLVQALDYDERMQSNNSPLSPGGSNQAVSSILPSSALQVTKHFYLTQC